MPNETEHPSQKVSKSVGGCGMSEKVRLPKDVCDALDDARSFLKDFDFTILEMTHHKQWSTPNLQILNQQDSDEIMRALVLGYEAELSPEEQTIQLWNKSNPYVKDGIKQTLLAHNIYYNWMDEE